MSTRSRWKTVWLIRPEDIKQGKLVYHIEEAICTKCSVEMYGEVSISTVTKDERKAFVYMIYTISAIGDNVFLSKEEAEARLKEMMK